MEVYCLCPQCDDKYYGFMSPIAVFKHMEDVARFFDNPDEGKVTIKNAPNGNFYVYVDFINEETYEPIRCDEYLLIKFKL